MFLTRHLSWHVFFLAPTGSFIETSTELQAARKFPASLVKLTRAHGERIFLGEIYHIYNRILYLPSGYD